MVDLVRRVLAVRDAAVIGGAAPRHAVRALAFFGSLNIWFWAIVGVPTLIAGVYYFGIASDLYVSEAKFVVRGPTKGPVSALSAMLGGAADSAVSEDTYAVHDYLMSRDVVRRLDRADDLRALLGRPEGDLLTRFPGVWYWRKDFEALYDAYSRFVSVDIDSTSGVSTLRVEAFRPADARRIAVALLSFSEQLVNALNARARHDSLAIFQREVDSTEQRIAKIQSQLTAYRVKQKMLDPKSAAIGPLELLAQLNAQLTSSKARLAEIIRNSPRSPQIRLVRTRIASLERLVTEEHSKITGEGDSVATALGEYERLDVQRLLAEKQLASAFTSLEGARLQAQRQQIYLETIAQPNLADYPLYPKRFVSFLTVVVTCLLAYGIAWLLIASVREHAAA
ncbi:MAG TPA: capsule biosynthesis protein [Stellaceae bacterium]|nr:capsule biosynthesis protein [Stellaceae bacterium]